MLKGLLDKLLVFEDLTDGESQSAVDAILSEANSHETAAFLALMRAKGESLSELRGIVAAMRSHMSAFSLPYPVLDIVGTGGDGAQTVNISTGAAILAAACGVKIVKHGNRSVSSRSGSADLLEAIGVPIHQGPEEIRRCVEQVGIGFAFAPDYHPAMQKIKEVRRGLKIRTVFNLIGPLLNPASPEYLMVGVADPGLLEKIASVLAGQKISRALVFHSLGVDELTTAGPAEMLEVSQGKVKRSVLDPEALGFSRCSLEDLKGGDAKRNAELLLDVFEGGQGAIADTLILNAAVAVVLYGIALDVGEAVAMVRAAIQQGLPMQLLNQWRQS